MSEIERLKTTRKTMRSLSTKLINKIDAVLNDETITINQKNDELDEMYDQLIEKAATLKTLDSDIVNLIDMDEIEKDVESAEEIQEKILKYKHKIKKSLTKVSHSSNANNSNNEASNSFRSYESKAVKLPKLTINKFSGELSNWLEFWNQFDSAINKNESLSIIDRFNFLKSYLSGTALNAIAGFALTPENYEAALKLLHERFGRRDLVINSHMNKLLNLEPVRHSGNVRAMRRLYDECEIQIRNLESLNVTAGTYGSLLCPILLKLVPEDLALEFSRRRKDKSEWDVKELTEFIRNEVECREASILLNDTKLNKSFNRYTQNKNDAYRKSSYSKGNIPTAAALTTATKNICLFCGKTHNSDSCKEISVEDKRNKLRREGRCYFCFRRYHTVATCGARMNPCALCGKKHNRSVCNLKSENFESKALENQTVVSSIPQCRRSNSESKGVLLQTCTAEISSDNKTKLIRCLLDSASERTFLMRSVARDLKLKIVRKEKLSVFSFGARSAKTETYDVVRVKLRNVVNPSNNIVVEALVTDIISSACVRCPDTNIKKLLSERNWQIADSATDNSECQIGLLIGADYFWEINSGRIERINKHLFASNTLFGWTVQGHMSNENTGNLSVLRVAICESEKEVTNKDLERIWDLDAIGIKPESNEVSRLDEEIINEFERNLSFKDNRYETKLLWKLNKNEVGNNFKLAKRRFENLGRRLNGNEWVFEKYKEIINDQLKSGIIEECSSAEDDMYENEGIYYMPHRPVIREDKSTTKVRIVFDASSREKNCKSLNDCLVPGPNLNPKILDLLLGFREKSIAFCGDVEKAFLTIGISKEDREYLRFLWFDDKVADSWKIMRMTRVPFGVTTSPFLLAATIKHHIRKYETDKREVYQMLNSSLYVDDLFYGSNSVSDAYCLSSDAVEILKAAGMNLRKLQTNSKELRSMWIQNGIIKEDLENYKDNPLKVLGIIWNADEDVFKLEVQLIIDDLQNVKYTKRGMVKVAAQIFDPVGFITPFIIRIKSLLQEVWEKGIDWDEDLPDHLKQKFERWCSEITCLKNLTLNRKYFVHGTKLSCQDHELHIFSDASPRAYGAVAYFRYQTENGEFKTSFIMSKSRVAPLKRLTLPRLELMGGLIAARISNYLMDMFKFPSTKIFLWTDSTIALHWIKGSARDWKPFVSNRVTEIQSITDPQSWKHCRGKDNPADLLTRGETAKSLLINEIWWNGPIWLTKSELFWPSGFAAGGEVDIGKADLADERKVHKEILQLSCNVSDSSPLIDIEKFSKLTRLYRVTAWIRRFVYNLKPGINRIAGPLTAREIADAEIYWVKQTQQAVYGKELSLLIKGQLLDKASNLFSLNPEFDSNGILSLKGRLQFAHLTEQKKHPWLLPSRNKFVELLIWDAHDKVYHCGVEATLISLREKFWILKGRQFVKTVLKKCLICNRFRAKPGSQVVAPLPANRILESPPFAVSGLDFAGPMYVKDIKYYVLLCTCAVTRAIHLELVSSLSTEHFLLAFRRFIARRGLCSVVYTDNAKTFKRADVELKRMWEILNHSDVQDFYGNKGIEWKFIVERGAWWGGFWERMVKTVKGCLRKSLGKTSLSLEELETVLIEIEAVINSRPLTFVTNDSQEPSPLAPAHFLIGKRINSLPYVSDLTYEKSNSTKDILVKKYHYRQKLLDHFWRRWREEYLLNLKSANSAIPGKTTHFKVDDVVMINDKRYQRYMWNLGKVIEVFVGRDGKVRSCAVKTKAGVIKRPIQLLHKLELDNA